MGTKERPTHPSSYTTGHHESVLKTHGNRRASVHAAYLLPSIKRNDLILDVGCGPGSITLGLAERAPDGWTVGIDFSPVAIEAAKQHAQCLEKRLKCEFRTGDAYAIEWDKETFDVVHAHQCLIHLAEPVLALKEMKRVCKIGGIVAARDGE